MYSVVNTDSAREARLRRRTRSAGLALHKSWTRVPEARDFGRFWVIEPNCNVIIAGGDFGWTLDDVDEWLSERVSG